MNGKRGNGEGSIYPYRNGGFAVRIRQAGVRAIPLRNTRHTTGSLLVAMKVHPKVAQRILRHSKFTMTFDVYSEASDEEIREALQRLSHGFGQGPGSRTAE